MKYLNPFRLATYLLVLFFLGHTGGGMLAQKPLGPAPDAVFASMKSVHFQFNGATCSYYGFWFGFGLMVSAFLLLSAVIAWHLGGLAPEQWSTVAPIAWGLCGAHAFNTVLAWAYFFPGPGILSITVTLLLGIGAIRKRAIATVAQPA